MPFEPKQQHSDSAKMSTHFALTFFVCSIEFLGINGALHLERVAIVSVSRIKFLLRLCYCVFAKVVDCLFVEAISRAIESPFQSLFACLLKAILKWSLCMWHSNAITIIYSFPSLFVHLSNCRMLSTLKHFPIRRNSFSHFMMMRSEFFYSKNEANLRVDDSDPLNCFLFC